MKKIPLANSDKMALVDDEDYEYLMQWRWHLSSHGYAVRTEGINYKTHMVFMHHEVMARRVAHDNMIDHADCEKLVNTRFNLRRVNMSQNKCNAPKHKDNKSGYKGVCWHKSYKRWVMQIRHLGTNYVSYHHDKIEAAKEYDRLAKKLHGVHARFNFPEEKD